MLGYPIFVVLPTNNRIPLYLPKRMQLCLSGFWLWHLFSLDLVRWRTSIFYAAMRFPIAIAWHTDLVPSHKERA
ncbi:MAG: hypothetical protein WBB28_14110 [Crinalium sp.]